jgi:alkanesulfonate monooxygenase SsuD/methylene tetrahydromethanopterin reductase-like flavin-dependent oxidoreductase (luciferase family)
MTIKLAMFMMPFHPYDRYGAVLAEDQEPIVLADRLGFTEAFVGEHLQILRSLTAKGGVGHTTLARAVLEG